ncbi:YoaK family protein [Streptomyces sp. NPDC004327]|uniref:YoaK family protein n=1 Tax=Streptomyces sp. NPDC004327 TaxID=3364699 RepID=UPI0036D054D1
MRTLLVEAVRTLVPAKGDRHGPLPPVLLALTVVTGLVDAVSFLGLGQVFVANMTGNVVFLGFALAGGSGLSATASAASLAAFLAGAAVGGRFGLRFGFRFGAHRGRLLASAMAVQAVLVAVALGIAGAVRDAAQGGAHARVGTGAQYTLIVLLALAMGLQNAVARRLGVPNLVTTVLTMTLTGIAADAGAGGRRILNVLAMFLGALVGALLLKAGMPVALGVALTLLVAGAAVLWRVSGPDVRWAAAP